MLFQQSWMSSHICWALVGCFSFTLRSNSSQTISIGLSSGDCGEAGKRAAFGEFEGNQINPSILQANVQSLDNKIVALRERLNYQRDIKSGNILCITELWLNDDNINILAGYTMYRQDRTAASGKTRECGLCIFVNNSRCTISKEISSYCSPEVEFLMISCRPHYLPREFKSIFFVAVYIPAGVRGWH